MPQHSVHFLIVLLLVLLSSSSPSFFLLSSSYATTVPKFFKCPLYTLQTNHTIYKSFNYLHPNYILDPTLEAECAVIPLALDPSQPYTPFNRIELFVKRVKITSEKNSSRTSNDVKHFEKLEKELNSLWILPGISPTYSVNYNHYQSNVSYHSYFLDSLSPATASSVFFEPLLDRLSTLMKIQQLPFQYIYTLDHRGVGASQRLSCVASQAETNGSISGKFIDIYSELKNCAVSNSDSNYLFSSVNAAIDVVSLMKMLHSSNEGIFLYGNSYGTVWLSRFMRYLELNQANVMDLNIRGVVMDGVMATVDSSSSATTLLKRFTFDQTMLYQNEALANYLKYCDMPSSNQTNVKKNTCQEKLQQFYEQTGLTTAISLLQNTIQLIYENGTMCEPMLDIIDNAEYFRQLLTRLLSNEYERVLIPAILYRLNRCDMDLDVPTLQRIFSFMIERREDNKNAYMDYPLSQSPLLGYNIIYSEMWTKNITLHQMEILYNQSIGATRDALSYKTALDLSQWKTYDLDPQYDNVAFSSNVPILMLNGELDPLTPVEGARNQFSHIQGNSVKFIEIPFGAHFSLFNTPIQNSTLDCGLQILINFLSHANVSQLNLQCLQELSFNFTGSPSVNLQLAGVLNIYEDMYEAPEPPLVFSMFLMIGIVLATFVVALCAIILLTYALIDLKIRMKNQLAYVRINQ